MRSVITADEVLTIARLALALGEVERVPMHPDGVRHETDTTHSLMLALVAAIAADRMGLDAGRAALLALVHDLPEAYAGDTDTSLGLSPEQREDKARREHDAMVRIFAETESMPLLRALLLRCEAASSLEAQVVRLLDKAMPKAVRLASRREGSPEAVVESAARNQAARLRQEFHDPALEPLHQVSDELRAMLFGQGGGHG